MDLSELDFMDSSGLKVMIDSINSASTDGWSFTIGPDLTPQVRKLFRMTSVDRFVDRAQRDG